jgi:hypothetical protein
MLELSDPLWNKLDDAHGVHHIPTMLSELAMSWDDETAKSLLFDDLCHQETCYGATYAAIPHLLKIAEPKKNRRQRREIAFFLGFIALCARDRHCQRPFDHQLENGELQGLPETIEGWDRKLDCYRSLVESVERPDRSGWEHHIVNLPRYKQILATEPVNVADLEKILSIKAGFFSALPAIRALCERTLLENEDEEAVPYLLSGIAAADGLLSLARLLAYGDEGAFTCSSCGSGYHFILFGERIAAYAEDPTRIAYFPGDNDKGLSDYREGAPSRADGFMTPIAENDIIDPRITALLSIAERAASPDLPLRVRHFAGTFLCCKCGGRGPMHAV